MPDDYLYVGKELDVFRLAVNWKRYWAKKIDPYLGARVLEVGAGIGSNTRQLIHQNRQTWIGLEPDRTLFNNLQKQIKQNLYPAWCDFRLGTIAELPPEELFDSLIYIDVLEHIENDREELELAARHLDKGGFLIVLAPAYQFLFSEFDSSIGHYRRYTRQSLLKIAPPGTTLVKSFYLDSVGVIISMANKFLLHSPQPSTDQITIWDKYIIPISMCFDPLHRYSFGRSIVAVWQRKKEGS